MVNATLLNNIDHADLHVVVGHSAAFGDSVNQTLIFPTEFDEISGEYPILIRRDAEGTLQPVALLGLDRDENLFLDEAGWQARYIPALHRRGPFLIGFQDRRIDGEHNREPTIMIDLDDPRVGRERGAALFLPHGGTSPYLAHIADVLRTIHLGVEMTTPMFAAFEALGLIEPVAVEIKLSDTESYALADYYTIPKDRFAALEGAGLERLHRDGFLGAAFAIIASLRHINRLIELKNSKRGVV